jgi:hypothetical protein
VREACGSLDLTQEAVRSDGFCQVGIEDFDGDWAVVLQILGQVDGGHATAADFALDGVAALQSGVQAGHTVGHQVPGSPFLPSRACVTSDTSGAAATWPVPRPYLPLA